MNAQACVRCANLATSDELRFQGNDLVHKGECPPMPDGWLGCDECNHGTAPIDQVPYLNMWEIDWDTRELWRLDKHPAHIPTPPRWVMREPGTEGLNGVVDGAAGVADPGPVVLEADGDLPELTLPFVVCQACSDSHGWPKRTGRGQAPAIQSATVDSIDQVATDKPGLSKPELMDLWGFGDRKTRDLIAEGVRSGQLLVTEVPTAAGGASAKRYRKAE